MDPSSLVSEGPFVEMWPLPRAAGDQGAVLWMHPGPAEMAPPGRRSGFADGGGGDREAASVEESTVTEQSGGIRSWRKWGDLGPPGAAGPEDESSRVISTCCVNELTESEDKCLKGGRSRVENGESKPEVEANSGTNTLADNVSHPAEASKQDYIHVRARRGQATDSHSLAERARREKIGERMKILQDLVPGCNKVIGKALVLDEIINYIQSLQCQVEFLSMKLEALSSQVNPSVKGFPAKDLGIRAFDITSGFTFKSQPTGDYGQGHSQGSQQEWLHMQAGGSI